MADDLDDLRRAQERRDKAEAGTQDHPWDLPTHEVLPEHPTGWTPKYTFGIPSDRAFNAAPDADDGTWVHAPATSHISRFKYVDARENSLQRRFGRRTGMGTSDDNPHTSGASQLHVVFRGKDGQGETAEYGYFFDRHDWGADVFERMSSSGHPYGNVLYPDVIKGGVPYQRLSRI